MKLSDIARVEKLRDERDVIKNKMEDLTGLSIKKLSVSSDDDSKDLYRQSVDNDICNAFEAVRIAIYNLFNTKLKENTAALTALGVDVGDE